MTIDFDSQKKLLQGAIEESEMILEANKIVKDYNWHFINPYIQLFRIKNFIKWHKNKTLTPEKVSEYFINDFFDLGSTICFVDGFFSRSQYIEPFNYYIEYSLILCFQKDYAAAINLIIPSIEGMLANYLIVNKNIELSGNRRYEKIKKSIRVIKDDLLELYIDTESQHLNKQQKDFLISLKSKYLENWVSIINSFFNDSIFAHSDNLEAGNLLNRHMIFHQLKIVPYHTLENYIKLFNAIKFMSWMFLKMEQKPILNQIDDDLYIRKRIHYEEIIKKSAGLLIHKNALLNSYSLHNPELKEITD